MMGCEAEKNLRWRVRFEGLSRHALKASVREMALRSRGKHNSGNL